MTSTQPYVLIVKLKELGLLAEGGEWIHAMYDALDLLSELMGPKCKVIDCGDYDGEHPFHQHALIKIHDLERENVWLREELKRRDDHET